MENPKVISFAPGTFIELDDPLSGKRRLVLVAESGVDFYDYLDEVNPTPLGILDVLSPVEIGDCRSLADELMLGGNYESYKAFSEMLLVLCDTPAANDKLTLNRAAKWAFDNKCYDTNRASSFGVLATVEAKKRQGKIVDIANDLVNAEVF
ncbi:hypothetical protein [Methylotenera sp.]|uniref:hypothetical protein n=1 Tax=Methylotenera sp. TaxID=2051956 RepID=UPI00248813F9|nr:hypothetical protein [Methylotenera sp.]MDI1299773.1 hypothetical protein [Methylotenera sp.]